MGICNFNLTGIQNIYIGEVTGDSINHFYSGTSIVLSADTTFTSFDFADISFSQKRTSDTKGVYFAKEFKITVPDFMEQSVFDLEGKNLVLTFKDNNGNNWVSGHEKTYSLDKNEGTNSNNDNQIEFTLTQNSYSRVQPLYEQPIILDNYFTDESNSPYLDVASEEFLITGGSATSFVFNVKFSDVINNQVLFGKDLQYRYRVSNNYLYWDTYNDGWESTRSNTFLSADTWYIVIARTNLPSKAFYVSNWDTGYGTEVFSGFTGWSDVNNPIVNPNPFKLSRSAEVRCLGFWGYDFGFSGATIFDDTNFNYYSTLPSWLKDADSRLMVFWDIDLGMAQETILDKHIHNINLTYSTS